MPTIKQKKAFSVAVENGGKISTAMREVGYSPATAKTPQKLTESKGWTELLEEFAPDSLLVEKLSQGLESTRVVSAVNASRNATADSTDFVDVPDFLTRHKYLETALKLKKRLTDKLDVTSGGKPIPLLSGIDVHNNNSSKETEETNQED